MIRWVLAHPDAITLEELEEWAGEFENRELQELMALIIGSYREHGRAGSWSPGAAGAQEKPNGSTSVP